MNATIKKLLERNYIEQEDNGFIWITTAFLMTFEVDGLTYIVDRINQYGDVLELYDVADVMADMSEGYEFYERIAL